MNEEDIIAKITVLIQNIQNEYLKIEENPGSDNDSSMEKIDKIIDNICLIIINNKIINIANDTDDVKKIKYNFIKSYIERIFSININFNNEERVEEEEYKLVEIDIDAFDDSDILSPEEKKFLFFMNYNLVSRNLIPRIKPLFKLIHALKVLNIKSDLEDPKIIALYAYDNIFPIETLRKISTLIYNKVFFTTVDSRSSSITNYQQLKYIYGILISSAQFDGYRKTRGKMAAYTGSEKHIYDTKIIYDFINNIISADKLASADKLTQKYDLYNLDCDTYFINEEYKEIYEISLHQFNMLISLDIKYIENMFGILFIELNDDDIEKISRYKNIYEFAGFLFRKDYFYKKLNYMHNKEPHEVHTIIDKSTKVKISDGLDKLINISSYGSATFGIFKSILLTYIKDKKISEDISSDTSIQGDVKHTIDTLMKIYYEAYILGKKCNKSVKTEKETRKRKLITTTQGGKYYNYKNTGIKKIFNKKERCIYKMQGSNKEYIRHKNELISFKDFKTINSVKTEKKPVKTEKIPVKTEKKSVKTEKKSVKTEKKSVKTDKKPVKTDKKPVNTDKKPAKTDNKSVKTDKKPVKMDKKPVKTDKNPVKTDKKPVKTENKPVKMDKKPVKTDKKPVKNNIFFNLF